ncbi:MAG: hypothetical protein IKO06_04080 [Alphaproteobacteria bacterium]|nr:hypothetical protein [Alphaproteobacteria bacterium]
MRNFEIKNNDTLSRKEQGSQSGRSMIEMLGVLAIIGVLSVGGIAGYSKAMQKYRINKTIEQITLIAGNVRTFFAPQRSYDGVSCYCGTGYCSGDGCSIIRKAKILPDEMIVDTQQQHGNIAIKVANVFGNSVDLGATDDNKSFYIGYGLPFDAEICIELATKDWSVLNAMKMEIQGPAGHVFSSIPADMEEAVTYCANAANSKGTPGAGDEILLYIWVK